MKKPWISLLKLCLLLIVLIGTLNACGRRPDKVDAPEGTDGRAFPRTYPDISTDPHFIKQND